MLWVTPIPVSAKVDFGSLRGHSNTMCPLRWLRKYQHTPSVGIKVNYRRVLFWKESDGVCHSVWLAQHVNCWLPSINKQFTSKRRAVFFPYKQKNQNVYVCEYVCLYCKGLGTQLWKNPLQRVENARSQDLALRNFEQNMSGSTVMYWIPSWYLSSKPFLAPK